MKNLQQIYKRALWSCIILFLIKPAPVYTASAYRESASTSQELVKKMLERQQLTPLEVDKRALLKEKILGHIGNHDADFSPSSQSAAQILSRMSLEAAFESIKAKGAITPAITEYLRAYSSVIHRSEKFDRQEVRGLDDYDMWGNSSASIPEEAPIYSSSVNMHNKDAGRCVSFLGEEDKSVIGFEARLLKESGLLSTLRQDKETNLLAINKMLTPISLKELYFALEASADNNLEAYLTSKNESELIKIANTTHYLEIQKLYEAVTDHVARIIAEDSTPATSFAQIFFDSGTSITGSMKKNVQEKLQDILPKNIIDDIVQKIGFKFSGKCRENKANYNENHVILFRDNVSPDRKFRVYCNENHFEPVLIYSNVGKIQPLAHRLDWTQKSSEGKNVAWSADSKKFSLGSDNGRVGIFEADTWEPIQILMGHTKNVEKTVWSSNELLLASASNDGTICIWNTIAGNLLHTLNHAKTVAICFAPNNRYLASASSDGMICIWNVSNGKLVYKELTDSIIGKRSIITWLPDSLKIASEVATEYKIYAESYGLHGSVNRTDTGQTRTTLWVQFHTWESETFEQKKERVYRFIQRAVQADTKQAKAQSSSCVIN